MRKLQLLLGLLFLAVAAFAQKPTFECVNFREGFDKFPLPGKGTITLNSGESIEGEFRQGMVIKMNKWQWFDTAGQLHQIKEKDVQRVVFFPDPTFVDKDIEIAVNISVGGNNMENIEQKNLPFNVTQFKDFDQKKFYEPLILERVVKSVNNKGDEKSGLMVLLNNGFDSKYKVYVNLGAHSKAFGEKVTLFNLLFGGGEMGKYYKAIRVLKVGEKESMVISEPALFSFWFGKFRNKEFVKLFGDNADFMACYPKSMKRKFKYTPEFFWVYDQK